MTLKLLRAFSSFNRKTDCGTWNLYAYCAGNPIKYVDPSGHFLDVFWDVASAASSVVTCIAQPSWTNLAYVGGDVAAIFVPGVPATGGLRFGAKIASKADDVAKFVVKKGDDVVKVVKNSKVVKKASKVVKSAAKKADDAAKKTIKKVKSKVSSSSGGSKKPNKKGKNSGVSKKSVNLPSAKKVNIDMGEVVSGHTSGGLRAKQSKMKDLFPDRMSTKDIEKEIRQAYGNAKQVGSSQFDGAATRIKLQGRGRNGVVEMWYNKATKTIETAYPVGGRKVKI